MHDDLKKIMRVLSIFLLLVSIFGTVNVLADETIFKVLNIAVKEKSEGVILNNVSVDSGAINNDIVFTNKDDYIKYDVTIKNDSEEDYTIKSVKDDNESQYIKYTYEDLSGELVKAGEEKTFELTITYVEETTQLNLLDKSVRLSVEYNKQGTAASDELIVNKEEVSTSSEEEEKVVQNIEVSNPNTSDGVVVFMILGVVSIIGLIISTKNIKSVNKSLIVAMVISGALLPMVVSAESDKFLISFNNNIKVKEYTVTYKDASGNVIDVVKAVKGTKLDKPVDPIKDSYEFDNWYTNSDLESEYNFDELVEDDITIFAKFDKILNLTVVNGDVKTSGSEVCFGTQCFYVVSNDGKELKLLSKYMLKVADQYKEDEDYNLQYNSFKDDEGVKFASEAYWVEHGVNQRYTKKDLHGSYYIYDENSLIYPYVNKYEQYLVDNGFDVTARLMSTDEAASFFGCTFDTNYKDNYACDGKNIDIDVENGHEFWLGNEEEQYYVWRYGNGMSGMNYDVNWAEGLGVRPLVVVDLR